MGNQHKLIKGYRDLNQEEIDLMNEGKELAAKVGEWIAKLESATYQFDVVGVSTYATDLRWVVIGKTDLQKGFMAAIRSIAQPTTF